MGLFDGIIGQLLGGAGVQGGPQSNLLTGLIETVQSQPGGLNGLMERFNSAGLGNIVQSWISNAPNLPISPQQIQQAMGDSHIQQLAQQAGISPQEVASHLSTMLPQLVDKLTPNGQLPSGGS